MLNDKSILVTGGTGSFGKKFIQTVLERYTPRRIIVFSRDELKQYDMAQKWSQDCMRYFLGDVRDAARLDLALKDVDVVIHAAALKQVPALEYNPGEAIKTNILGTENVITAAIAHAVSRVIVLSTDKAAGPINLYGATKLAADKLTVAANNMRGQSATRLSVVRYGNVVGSRGSVIPHFQRLVQEGAKEIPITDERMTRFLITLQQGVDFVLKSLERMQGGELFVPRIPSATIETIARAVSAAIPTRIVGIRPGEKLHEVMCPSEQSCLTLEFEDFYLMKPSFTFHQSVDYTETAIGERGSPVQDGFEYCSKSNPDFMTVDALKSLIADAMPFND
jgi:UDP-N-acetylglucosamine 4,6-dehydratase